MPNTIIKFVVENKSLLTTVIAIAGFVLSLFQFIHSLWSKRTNISVSLETLCTLNVENKKSIKLGLIFQNNSSSPIIITKVSLLLNHRASYSCVLTHRWVAERYYPKHNETDIPITERIFSADFPISLQSSQGIFEIVLFDIPANIKLSKDFITLKIITNKKNKTYILQVPKENKDLLSI